MLRWLTIVTAILVVAVVFVTRDDKLHNTEGKGYDIKCTQSSDPSATVGTLICTAEHSQKAKSSDSDPQWWRVFFAWPEGITALLIMLTLGAIIWQAWETRKAAKATKEGANAAMLSIKTMMSKERARISIEIQDAILTEPTRVRYKITSHGPTPAFIEDTWIWTRVIPLSEMDWPESKDIIGWTIPIPSTLKESEIDKNVFVFMGGIPDAKSQIENGKLVLQIMARIEYSDVFGDNHETWVAKYFGNLKSILTPSAIACWRNGPKAFNRQT